jgi:tripartite-type tricarboxylate transporter receptor subunit TctC
MHRHHGMHRREFITAALGSTLLGSAWGLNYPDRKIKLVLPVQPGSAVDVTARRIAPALEGVFGQPLVVDNRPGNAGLIATAQLVRSPTDGYTLAMVSSSHCISTHLYKASFHPLEDIQPIVAVTSGPLVFVVHVSLPVVDVTQFLAYAKSRSAKAVTLGSAGNGTLTHIASALFSQKANFKALHIPYKGSGSFAADLAGGQIDAGFLPWVAAAPLIRAERVRAIGISTSRRLPGLPEVPTLSESGIPDFDVDGWVAAIAPRGTPLAIVERLNRAYNEALHAPDFARFVAESGGAILGGSIKDCESLFQRDFAGFGRLIASAGIKAD